MENGSRVPQTSHTPSTPDSLAVTSLKGVGPRTAARLARLGLTTVQDVLFHLPLRYQDRTHVTPIGSLRPGDEAVIEGEVQLTEVKYAGRRSLLSRISDGTGSLTLRFFHFSAAQQAGLGRGVRLRCYGEVRGSALRLEMIHPEYQRLPEGEAHTVEETLTPVYPATEGVHQLTLRALTEQALAHAGRLHEWLPDAVRTELGMHDSLEDAVRYLHRPPPDASLQMLAEGRHPAQQRLAFEELLAHHLSLRRLRQQVQRRAALSCRSDGTLMQALVAALPFRLTAAQQRVVEEIRRDLGEPHPMQRLVQGDVGCGKTLVAACAATFAVEAGVQVAVMAPTELLAEQHYRNFSGWLEPLGIGCELLTSRQRRQAGFAVLDQIGQGKVAVIIGTHALFQEGVDFSRLGLVIIDEQHRFGVHQRLALLDKGTTGGSTPHQLIMTATPIPRTLAMTFFADLDSSVIDELPPGRTAVTTAVVQESRRDEVVQRVRAACLEGRQAYWVCTLIEESEVLQCQAAEDTAALLIEALPELSVGLVHGRMKAADKERVMQAFKDGAINLLVATTVIEVGVDVPNASLMIIENAERLGLSQLHQLRGRVGRGTAASTCVLMYHPPLSGSTRARLEIMRDTDDGFEIARKDLELRGPGEVLGTRQAGIAGFRIAELHRDSALIPAMERAAGLLLRDYPENVDPLIRRWVGDNSRYGDV
jgi:ATP-dependent DNA helicase RecG